MLPVVAPGQGTGFGDSYLNLELGRAASGHPLKGRGPNPWNEDETMRKTAILAGAALLPLVLAACASAPEVASNEDAARCTEAGLQPSTPAYDNCLAAQRHQELRNFADLTIHGPAGH
jgi:hypothetical protein